MEVTKRGQEKTGDTPVHIQHSALCRTPRAKQNTWFQLIAETCSASSSTKTRRGFEPEPLQIRLWVDGRVPTAERATGKSEHQETRSVFEKHNLKFFLLSQIRACGKTTGSSLLLMSKKRHAAAPPFAAGAMQNTGTFFLSHPPNSHTVQAQRRTFHISQNKN